MYSAKHLEALFSEIDPRQQPIQWDDVGLMRTSVTKHGPMLSIACYPLLKTGGRNHAIKALKASREAQRALNEENSRRRMRWKMNANFGPHDIIIHPRPSDGEQPKDAEEAKKVIRWFIREIKKLRKNLGLGPMKYIYVIEMTEEEGKGTRYHYHMITNGEGIENREQIERIWLERYKCDNSFCRSDRYRDNPNHLAGWAEYMNLNKPATGKRPAQKKATKRRWSCSTNLIKPEPKTTDRKISRAQAQKIVASAEIHAREVLEKKFPGYELVDGPDGVRVKTSEFVQGAYIYIEMRKKRNVWEAVKRE